MKKLLSILKYVVLSVGVAYLLMLSFFYLFPPELSCKTYPMFNLPSPDGRHTAVAFQEVCNDGKLKTVVSLSGDFPASSIGQKTVVFKAESAVRSDKIGEVKPLDFSARWLTQNRLQITIPDQNVVFLTKQSNVNSVDIVYERIKGARLE